MKRPEPKPLTSGGAAIADPIDGPSYRGPSISSLFHRYRLSGIVSELGSLGLPAKGALADFGCSDGSVGMPCDHDSQCDEAAGVICAASLLCEDGSAGVSCSQAGDCAVGLVCSAGVCSAT